MYLAFNSVPSSPNAKAHTEGGFDTDIDWDLNLLTL